MYLVKLVTGLIKILKVNKHLKTFKIMTKGINRVALRQRRVNALNRLKEQEPRDAKHEKYINTQIKNVEHNIKNK